MLVLARRWREDLRWAALARFSRLAAYLAIIGLVAFVAMKATEAEEIDGLAQRVHVLALLGWMLVTGLRLREASTPSG